VTEVVLEELRSAQIEVVRSVTVNREKQFIGQLVRNVSTGNEADVIVLIGGAGIGPRDYACEAIDALSDRRIEGFGEEYRRVLREDPDSLVSAVLSRAVAGVCDGTIVVALPRQSPQVLRRAVKKVLLPILPQAVRIAGGGGHA
jgi:molybdopterin biosynthesis enzyme MoaB